MKSIGIEEAQFIRLDRAAKTLAAVLVPFPRLVIDGCGMEPDSLKNRFRIRDQKSRRYFEVLAMYATDFNKSNFGSRLKRFLVECEC